MRQITVVTLGPGNPAYLTRQAEKALKQSRHLILRTARHRAADWLREEGVDFASLDDFYDRYEDFDAMHKAMADHLWEEAARHAIVFAVQDAVTDGAVHALRNSKPEDGVIRVVPGVSGEDVCLSLVDDPVDGFRSIPASRLADIAPDYSMPLLISEVDTPLLAGQVKLFLSDLYGVQYPVVFFPSTANRNRLPVRIPLCDMDRQPRYDHTVCLFVPAADLTGRERYCFEDLTRIMKRLRAEDGCPWDRQQTHQSLRKYLLEEAYEAAGAIDEQDMDHLADELGDVLLQIVFHAQIGAEHGEFNAADVASAVCAKMIRRHPHVFGQVKCDTPSQVSANWEQIKLRERHHQRQSEALADVSSALPALTRAAKVQGKAARVGFDWPNALDALPKVIEEAGEVEAELRSGSGPLEELGDLLFAAVNVVRLAGCDPEEALTFATDKFVRRFTAMEEMITADGKALPGMALEEMDRYWNRVKAAE